MTRRMTRMYYISAGLRLALAACTAFIACPARAGEPAPVAFTLNITDGKVPAPMRTLKVIKGDQVRITVTSNRAGTLHLHGYRLEAVLAPGTPADFAFRAHATGRYPLEWHGPGNTAASGGHHGPPMAALEVRPR